MVRACHRETCPVGIATQRKDLRAKFPGTPEKVARYLVFVAEETVYGLVVPILSSASWAWVLILTTISWRPPLPSSGRAARSASRRCSG